MLVIDDDALVVRGLARALGRENDITTALGGLAAIDILLSSNWCFDVILCDLLMPGMGGIALYRELVRRAPQMADRVIFLSGDVSSARLRVFLDTVRNVALEKPVDTAVLRAAIREVFLRPEPDDLPHVPFASAS